MTPPQQGDVWRAQHPRAVPHTGAGGEHDVLLDEAAERQRRGGHVGARLTRSDGPAKVAGGFIYSSDLRVEGMLFGATVRSPHAAALIRGIDVRAARALPGVHAVLTHDDVPGDRLIGSVIPDQPVLAADRGRHPPGPPPRGSGGRSSPPTMRPPPGAPPPWSSSTTSRSRRSRASRRRW